MVSWLKALPQEGLKQGFFFSNECWSVWEVRHLFCVNINASEEEKKGLFFIWRILALTRTAYVGVWCRDSLLLETLALFLLAYGDNTHAAKSANDMCERVGTSLYGVRLGPTRRLNFNYLFCHILFLQIKILFLLRSFVNPVGLQIDLWSALLPANLSLKPLSI